MLESDDAARNAIVSQSFGGTYYHYVQGIAWSIEALLEKWRSSGKKASQADFLIFPMGLLCRHLIELQLKRLGQDFDVEANVSAFFNNPKESYTHSLQKIWIQIRSRIEIRWPGSNTSTAVAYAHLSADTLKELGIEKIKKPRLDRLGELIDAFHHVDPRGEIFRYPGTMPGHVRELGLDKLARIALEIS